MLAGYNHNLRHEGMLFHVQTEDCGSDNPVVVTHVFVGGNILATRRSSYEKFVRKAAVREIVQAIMQEQHKEVMKDLVHGRLPSVQKLLNKPRVPVAEPETTLPPVPIVRKPPVPPPQVAERPYRRPAPVEGARTLDTTGVAEKTLDELILDFLAAEKPKKP